MAQLRQKLNRTNDLLAKLRSSSLLITICFALFDSNLRYVAQAWGQGSNNVVGMIKRTQNKAPQIISFNPIQDGHFRACSRMGEDQKAPPVPKICHTYPTMMQPGTVIPYLNKIQKIYE